MLKLSIVIPAYGNAEYLPMCLDSILKQEYPYWEAIIVNDASPDSVSEVAHSYASRDNRFVVVDKPENGGLHLARKTGVERLSGDWVLFLDADDELFDEKVLGKLSVAAGGLNADIIRFGLYVDAEDGMPKSAIDGFTAWSNAASGPLVKRAITEAVFHEEKGFKVPWNMTHRLFDAALVRGAFDLMTDERLERAEDAYEFMVTASLAVCEIDRCDIMGYRYHMGFGVTNAREMTADQFINESSSMVRCYEAAADYSKRQGVCDLSVAVLGLKHKLLEAVGNSLNERVLPEERLEAERRFVKLVGASEAACEFYRFLRDLSWRQLTTDAMPDEDDEVFRIEELAVSTLAEATDELEIQRCQPIKELADLYMAELRKREATKPNRSPIRIFSATHRRAASFKSSYIEQIQVGSAQASERFWEMLHDDFGENISELNPYYCELTAQYWAWKNVDADYYGFCHYRRYFDFSETEHKENPWGEVIAPNIDSQSQVEYALDDDSLQKAVEGWDVITTRAHDLRKIYGKFSTPYEQWDAAPDLHNQDLIDVLAILEEMHPAYQADVDAYMHGHHSCFCNMFIMRKAVFFDYCNWLFPLLDAFMRIRDYSTYSREARRTPGHLAERLLNIYLMHQERLGAGLKTKQVQCVHFAGVDEFCGPRSISPQQAGYRPIVPVVFAADDAYVPMVTTTAYSMLKNASSDSFYHVVLLTTDISERNREVIRSFLQTIAPCKVDFVYVQSLVEGYKLTTSNAHIGVETYYRFLIQDILPFYDKVLYLDSDLIIEGDVSELYAVDVEGACLAAVIDVDFLGNLNLGAERKEYAKRVLAMRDPYAYFQAGVLVLNTHELRGVCSVGEWLKIAQNPEFIYNDQDILNKYCEGRVVFLDPVWNVMIDGGRIQAACSHAPAGVFAAYLSAREHERIIHFAGVNKPWNASDCDRGERYWEYARETPFYERLISLKGLNEIRAESVKMARKAMEKKLKPYLNKVAPPDSSMREAIRRLYSRMV